MALPTSTTFDLVDWNKRAATTGSATDALITNSTNGATVEGHYQVGDITNTSSGLRLRAEGGTVVSPSPAMTTYRLEKSIPASFSFEFDISFGGDLPEDFSSRDNRVFVGAVDTDGRTLGFLFSRRGIGVCASPISSEDDVITLGGSYNYMTDSSALVDSLTLRVEYDDTSKRATIFITPTAEAYDDDVEFGAHEQRFNIEPPASELDRDQILIALRAGGVPNADHIATISSLRLASGLVETPLMPVASIEAQRYGVIGQRIRLDGSSSYDPAGATLSYEWNLLEAPRGSTTTMRGGTSAYVDIGSAAADNSIRISKVGQDARDNTAVLGVFTAPGQPLDLQLGGRDLTIRLETDSAGNVITTAADLVEAFNSPSASGYSSSVAAAYAAELTDGAVGTGAPPVGTYTFSGGLGSSLARTSVQADKPGPYVFSLRVSNGQTYSRTVSSTVYISVDGQLLGHRPKMDYVWKSLPDFWSLVKDKEKMSVAWSAAAQTISGELVKLLQNDYAKSIKDISAKYQRRWMAYKMRVDVSPSLSRTLVMTSGGHYFAKPFAGHQVAGSSSARLSTLIDRVSVVDPDTGADVTPVIPPTVGDPAIVLNQGGFVTRTILEKVSSAGSYDIKTTADAVNAFRLVDSGLHAVVAQDPDSVGSTTSNLMTVRGEPLSIAQVQVGDTLVLKQGDTVIVRVIDRTVVTRGSPAVVLDKHLSFVTGASAPALTVDGSEYEWMILRPVDYCQIFQFPYFNLGANVDLRPHQFKFGDAVEVSFINPSDGSRYTTTLPLLHATRNEIHVDWRPMINDLNAVNSPPKPYTVKSLGDVFASIELKALLRTEKVLTNPDVISSPRLGEDPTALTLLENRDYYFSGGRLVLEPLLTTTGYVEKGSSKITLGVAPTETPTAVFVQDKEIGVYPVVAADGRVLTLAHTFSVTGNVDCRIPRYSFNGAVPKQLWSELTYFDNSKYIEDNFGILVGVERDVLESTDVDYRTLIKGLWFALMAGPQVENLKLACQAFINVPYTEVPGLVTVIDPGATPTEGRIVIKELGKPGYATYFYPNEYSLAVNPTTGRTIKSASAKEAEKYQLDKAAQDKLADLIADSSTPADKVLEYQTLLSKAQRVDDATLPRFTTLVDVVDVYDYVSEPDKIDSLFRGSAELEKFHTFVVELRGGSLSRLNAVPVMKEFVSRWKPAHTSVMFLGVLPLTEQIDVEEEPTLRVTMKLSDSAHTAQWTAASADDVTWPDDKTLDKNPAPAPYSNWDATDVHDKYESSYTAGVLDDVSGDGGWNEDHDTVDAVNTLDSDYDVINSQMWVPIQKDTSTEEFIIGEEVELLDGADAEVSDIGWLTTGSTPGAPPVVDFVGAGTHPRIPFNVYSPQNEYPETYLILGFHDPDGGTNYGTTDRLRALQGLSAATTRKVRGKTSGAVATVQSVRGSLTDTNNAYPNFDKAIDASDPDYNIHRWYFFLERVFSLDKLLETGPRLTTRLAASMYIPFGGATKSSVNSALGSIRGVQVQRHPYDVSLATNRQFVPSFGPGFYTQWDNLLAGDNVVWGYEASGGGAVGDLDSTPQSLFDAPAALDDLENIHIEAVVHARPLLHYTHGFVQYNIPGPKIREVSVVGGTTIRVEGYYFLDDDPTRVAVPSREASSFDGDVGGSWIFFRNRARGTEYAVSAITFETGNHALKTVLGISGANQTSDGHVLEATIPALGPSGDYDVIVRNYRPYKKSSGGADLYHVDTYVYEAGYTK